jgi:hypothetical protein
MRIDKKSLVVKLGKLSFCFLIAPTIPFLSSCSPTGKRTPPFSFFIPSDPETTPPELPPELPPEVPPVVVLQFKSTLLDVIPTVNSQERKIEVAGLAAGRMYSFALFEDASSASNFDCANLPATARIIDNRLHVDLEPQDQNGTLELLSNSIT